ncbi:MAG: PLP-dependent aminotransferase family protein [Erysipelotrichaceae bacterium]|nr:PLP-dependent aminotransferase family protein [Erysipelotrichaceae bacterium]
MLKLNKNDKEPVYLQIYRQLKEQIIAGELSTDERLPATRALCQEYHLSRNTVLNAYQQLESEGFIRSKIGSGYYVEAIPEYSRPETKTAPFFFPHETDPAYAYDFRYGALEPNLYKSAGFRKALREAVNELQKKDNLYNEEPSGLLSLRQAIAVSLLETRDMHVSPSQILITGGHHYSISLLQKILPSSVRTLFMEEPGHDDSVATFYQAGYEIVPIRVDDNGMMTDKLPAGKTGIAYVTPSHQFPLGAILPIARRLQLLKWADGCSGYIIEDDYDAHLRYKEQPIPSLYSLDRNGCVIYLGSFSKSLSPDLRISYIVLPASLHLSKDKDLISSPASTLIQLSIERYISLGFYKTRIAKIRNLLRKKHNRIVSFFHEHYGERIRIFGIGGGTHFVLSLPVRMKQDELLSFFRSEGIGVWPIEPYYLQKDEVPEGCILIGYGGIPSEKLDEYLDALKNVIDKLNRVGGTN